MSATRVALLYGLFGTLAAAVLGLTESKFYGLGIGFVGIGMILGLACGLIIAAAQWDNPEIAEVDVFRLFLGLATGLIVILFFNRREFGGDNVLSVFGLLFLLLFLLFVGIGELLYGHFDPSHFSAALRNWNFIQALRYILGPLLSRKLAIDLLIVAVGILIEELGVRFHIGGFLVFLYFVLFWAMLVPSTAHVDAVKNRVVRRLLWRAGLIPHSMEKFLEYAADHVLLEKVGSSYRFVHLLLRDYLADLDSSSVDDTTSL